MCIFDINSNEQYFSVFDDLGVMRLGLFWLFGIFLIVRMLGCMVVFLYYSFHLCTKGEYTEISNPMGGSSSDDEGRDVEGEVGDSDVKMCRCCDL